MPSLTTFLNSLRAKKLLTHKRTNQKEMADFYERMYSNIIGYKKQLS